MLIVGLTGGIASGKSTASHYFETLGTAVIDADILARQLVKPGLSALQQISARFGRHILNPSGELDRPALRKLIFNNDNARHDLESILHPLIQIEMQHQIDALSDPYCILVIPLLAENRQMGFIDRILVIDTDETLQYQRLKTRDHLDEANIKKIIHAQASRKKRLTIADDIATNNGDIVELHKQLLQYHQSYLQQGEIR